MLTTGVEPAVRAEAENSLAHTLELRFLKMFEFEDEEGVFYDVLVNSEKLRNSYFINFCFVQVRRLSGKLGASVAAKQELLHRLCQLFVVRNVLMRWEMNHFFTDCRLFFLCKMVDKLPYVQLHPWDQQDGRHGRNHRVPQSSVSESFVSDWEEDCKEMSERVGWEVRWGCSQT